MRKNGYGIAVCLVGGSLLAFAGTYLVPCLLNNVAACLVAECRDCSTKLLLLLLVLLAAKTAFVYGEAGLAYVRRTVEVSVCTSVVRRVYSLVVRAKPEFFERTEPEGLVRRMLRDAETLAAWRVALCLKLPLALIGVGLAIYTMFFGGWNVPALGIDAQRGCPILAVIVLVLSPTHFLFVLWNHRFAKEEQRQAEASELQYATGIEMLHGIADLRAANAFGFAEAHMNASTGSFAQTQCRVQGILSFLQGTDNAIASFAEIVFTAVAARMIFSYEIEFTYADYAGFVALQMSFHAALSRIVDIGFSWLRTRPAVRRIRELEQLPQIVAGTSRERRVETLPAPSIRLDRVSARAATGVKIASGVTLAVSGEEHVALVGPSGCGKSTALKVIARHLTAVEGHALMAERPVEEFPFEEFVSRVAIVSQRPYLFSGTVRENVLLGRDIPDEENRLRRIAGDIGIPWEALNRPLEADGKGLSGGQIAKVALARAAIGNPQILLLDEVTAALDGRSERRVLNFLATACRHTTVLFVTHRRSSMMAMDRVIRFASGKGVNSEKDKNE